MRRPSVLLIVLGVAIIAGAGVYWWYAHRAPTLPPYIVQTNGRLEFARIDIAVKYPGRIVVLNVHEGDNPESGQILARQDDSEVNAELAGARAQRAEAEGAIARAQAEVQAHRSSEALARLEQTQADGLYQKKLISDVELQRRHLALSSETAQVAAASGGARRRPAQRRDQADAKIAQLEVELARNDDPGARRGPDRIQGHREWRRVAARRTDRDSSRPDRCVHDGVSGYGCGR